MKQHNRSKGFSVLEVLIIIAVIGLIGLLGVVGYNRWQEDMASKETGVSDQSNSADDTAAVPDVNTTEDLDKVLESVDQSDVTDDNDADTKQLDSQAAAF